MPKTPLVPTPIVNKNGVRTTVHKRAHEPNKQLLNLPAPVVPFATAKEALVRVKNAIDAVYSTEDFRGYGISEADVLKHRLQKYTPAVIMAYDKAIKEHRRQGYEHLLISALHQRVPADKSGYLLFIAQHDKDQDTVWAYRTNGTYNHQYAEERYNGIKSLEGQFEFDIPYSVYETDDMRSLQIISALITATTKMYEADDTKGISHISSPGEGYTLNNDGLIELIVQRPEDAERIADIAIARDNPEASIIEEVLDAEQPALSDGLL